MRSLTRFALPEVHQAFMEWRALTGFEWDSPEWSDTLAALDRLDLLVADQAPQPALWDTDAELAELPAARRLRAAILGAARVHHDNPSWRYDLPTTAEIVVAFLSSWPAVEVDGPPLADVLLRLEVQVPRETGRLFDSRTDALATLVAAELHIASTNGRLGCLPELAGMLVVDAIEDDRIAARVFDRLAVDERWRTTLLSLSDGRWVLVHA